MPGIAVSALERLKKHLDKQAQSQNPTLDVLDALKHEGMPGQDSYTVTQDAATQALVSAEENRKKSKKKKSLREQANTTDESAFIPQELTGVY